MTLLPVPTGFISRGGLHAEVEVLPWARSFAAVLVVGCGSRDDPAGQEGVAHLVEHLMVVSDPATATSGVPIFAITEIDRTVYQAVGDPGDVGLLVRRLLDIAAGCHGRYGSDVFEGERHSVIVETRRMDHQPMLRLGPLLAAAAADEPGLDAIGRATAESVSRVTETAVADLAGQGYVPGNARLFVAGPPSVLGDIQVILDRYEQPPKVGRTDIPIGRHEGGTSEPPRPRGLGDLVAVTLVRPRVERSLAFDALLEPFGPILGFGTATPLRPSGRTCIEGRAQRVDVVVWREIDAVAPLGQRLAQTESDDWQVLVQEPLSRLRVKRAREREWRLATPAGRVGDAAGRFVFDGEPESAKALALWTITDGVAQLLARHPLVSGS
jgi:hypothetical protein